MFAFRRYSRYSISFEMCNYNFSVLYVTRYMLLSIDYTFYFYIFLLYVLKVCRITNAWCICTVLSLADPEYGSHMVSESRARIYNGDLGAEPLVKGSGERRPLTLKALCINLHNLSSLPVCPKIYFCITKICRTFGGHGPLAFPGSASV